MATLNLAGLRTAHLPAGAPTLAAALHAVVARQPGAPALWYDGRCLDYAQLEALSMRVAGALSALGVRTGDRLAIWMPNAPAWLVCHFALARLGAVTVAVNPRFRSVELGDVLRRSGARGLLYWPGYRGIDFQDILRKVAPEVPDLEWLIEYGEDEPAAAAPAGLPAAIPWAKLEQAAPRSAIDADGSTPCLLYTTSGTTNRPKLVMHVQGGISDFARKAAAAMGYDRPGACSLQMVPLCGTYGMIQAKAALFAGAPMVLHHRFDPVLAGELIRRHGVTLSGITDEMMHRLYDGQAEPQPFPGLCLFTGSRAGEVVEKSLQRNFKVVAVYGSSEVQALFCRRPDSDEPRQRAVGGGFPACPQAQVRARSLETGAILPHGEAGELEISAPSVMMGYYGDPETTERAFTADGWYRTGDVGYTSADGSFTFVTRRDDAMRLSGFLVNPGEIEAHVRNHPAVDLCHVVGIEHQGRTRPVAFCTLRPGQATDEAALLRHCAEGLARYKVPARFVLLQAMPFVDSANTPKVNRVELRRLAQQALQAMDDQGNPERDS